MPKIVVDVDLERLPPLTVEQKAELEALALRTDEHIDLSDLPELEDAFWKRAVRNPLAPENQGRLQVTIDRDVLSWFHSHGEPDEQLEEKVRRALRQYVAERS